MDNCEGGERRVTDGRNGSVDRRLRSGSSHSVAEQRRQRTQGVRRPLFSDLRARLQSRLSTRDRSDGRGDATKGVGMSRGTSDRVGSEVVRSIWVIR